MSQIVTRRNVLAGAAAAGVAAAWPTSSPAKECCAAKKEMPYRYRLSLAAYSFRKYLYLRKEEERMSMGEFIDFCAKMNLDATEPTSYYIYDNSIANLHELKARAFLQGLSISGTAINNNFCLPPGEERDKDLAHVRDWIDKAVQMGAPHLRIFAGKAPEQVDRDRDFKYLVEGLKPTVDYAASRGIFLGIENHGYMTESADDLLRIVDAVPSKWLGINLDSGNFDDNTYENFAKLAPKAVNCQMKTEIRVKGERQPADMARLFGILREAKYRGYVVLEYEGEEEPIEAVPRHLREMKALAGG